MARRIVFETELNKLKKGDLIKIIIDKKIPQGVEVSEEVLKLIQNENSGEFVNANTDSPHAGNPNLENNIMVMSLKCDLKVAKCEAEALAKIVKELERNVANQELIIELLKKNNDYLENQTGKSGVAKCKNQNEEEGKAEKTNREEHKKINEQIIWGCNEQEN